MRARLIVFPIKGKTWCFSRSIVPSSVGSGQPGAPSSLTGLWKVLSSSSQPASANAELVVDFFSNKMNDAWANFEKAPEKSFKNKVYGIGAWLLTRVKPTEIFLKSITKDVTGVDVTYPASLNGRLVHQRLRDVALSGSDVHKRNFYGLAALVPLTTIFTVLPLPNIPFFWFLFRTYSNWRALQGSRKLLQLVSDNSQLQNDGSKVINKSEGDKTQRSEKETEPTCLLHPSKELDELVRGADSEEGLSDSVITDLCRDYYLHPQEVLKYKS